MVRKIFPPFQGLGVCSIPECFAALLVADPMRLFPLSAAGEDTSKRNSSVFPRATACHRHCVRCPFCVDTKLYNTNPGSNQEAGVDTKSSISRRSRPPLGGTGLGGRSNLSRG